MPAFYSPELNGTTTQIILIQDEYHHLNHVLRYKIGDDVMLNSGKGWQSKGIISSISKTQAVVDIQSVEFHEQVSNYAIAFSLLRSKNDEWLVEKVTELGVSELFPMTTQYSVRNPSKNTLARFQLTALNAIKQCNNPWLPVINPIETLNATLQAIVKKGYVPILASENRPDVWITSLDKHKPYCFIIGPEGGFSPEEFELFTKQSIGGISVSRLILRAETAAITIAAQYTAHSNTI
jgi:16S rRNA (uracil1498-N3)-methyltransferase